MPITVKDIPAQIKADKNVTPFIARSVELAEPNPVVSYFCKIYVLEHILSQKLHLNGAEIESFTISLLDDTEAIKSSHSDETVQQVLQSRQLSINLIFVFAFRLFHSCLEDLKEYDGLTKPALVSKLRATLNFWALFSIFYDDETIDYAKTTGGTCSSKEEFVAFTREKTKTLKYQLRRLLKDEVPIKGEETELEQLEETSPETQPFDTEEEPSHSEASASQPPKPEVLPDFLPENKDLPSSLPENKDLPSFLPEDSAPNGDQSGDEEDSSGAAFSLPGAPKFNPGLDADSEIDLPGAPSYIPDEEPSTVNKSSSIKVIPPGGAVPPARDTVRRAESSKSVQVTKESVGDIVDATEQIAKVQKHAKFAISALNYEDLNTAEAELLKGLELLKLMKENA